MKPNVKTLISCVIMLLMAANVWAGGNVTIVKQLNGVVSTAVGEVTSAINSADGKCTVTVTPASAYFIESVTAEKVVSGDLAQARQAPGINEMMLTVSHDNTEDPSAVTTWTFDMPSNDYDVEVVANFQTRTSIADAVVTLAETSFDYDGQAKEPAVTSVVLGSTTLTPSTDYTFEYSDNLNAGTGIVTVTGQGNYTGTATATFTINKLALSDLTVSLEGWKYNEYEGEELNVPRVSGNTGEGAETFYYKVKGAADDTYTGTIPGDAGEYTIKVEVAETDNYQAGTATADFTIAKADIYPSVDLLGWVYGSTPNTPNILDNTSNADVTYTYAVDDPSAAPEYNEDVPTVAGNYIVKATFAETLNYNGAEATDTFYITKANLAEVVIADIADQTYTGNPITPTLTVTFKGNPVDASEYDVTYSEDNTNVGEVTVTLTSKDVNFVDGQTAPTKTFQIVAAPVEINAEDQTETYNGGQQLFTNYEADDIVIMIHYYASEADRTAGENELGVVQDAGTYYVQLVSGDANYTFTPVNVTFTIDPKDLTEDMIWSEGTTMVYDGELKTLDETMFGLTDGENNLQEGTDYDVNYANNTNVGTATATITGQGNYQGVLTFDFDIVRELDIVLNETRQWATYYAEENLSMPEGLKAYIVTEVNGSEVTVSEIDYIPQHVAVLLTCEEYYDSFLASAYTGATQTFANNMLQGTSTGIDVTTVTGGSVYVLYNNEFVKSVEGAIPANRGYLVLDPSVLNVPESRQLTIVIGENATGIADMKTVAGNDKCYNLQGRRVQAPVKGLYIMNGKKVIVR